jgi:hypothetical protein
MSPSTTTALLLLLLTGAGGIGQAQAPAPAQPARPRYPVRPAPLPEAEEIRLAESAAPREVSSRAGIYVLRATGPEVVRPSANGVMCMVARDLHEGSRYPICYDAEGSRTLMQQELMELRLRVEGRSEPEVKAAVAAAWTDGTLKAPARTALAYMMSAHQVLFTSPDSSGRHVGPWRPHLMISAPGARGTDFGLAHESAIQTISVEREGMPGAQLVVVVPAWADSTASRR